MKSSAETSPVMVGLFTGRQSLAAKMYSGEFNSLAEKFPAFSFFKCDVDSGPFAAYDAEVVDDFQVAVMPLGKEAATGMECTKVHWRGVTAERAGGASFVMKETDKLLGGLNIVKSEKIKRWEFDPATGTTTCVVLD